jgi:hypothetical protein
MVLVWYLSSDYRGGGVDFIGQEQFKKGCLSHLCIKLITLEVEYGHRIYVL